MSGLLGFIGAGHMGGALAEAACRGCDPGEITICDANAERAKTLAGKLGCSAGDTAGTAAGSKYVVIGVKPQNISELFQEIAPVLAGRDDRFVIVSMAAGITIERITAMAGADCPVIRIMPNTPVAVGAGCILYSAGRNTTEEDVSAFLESMREAGSFVRIDESLMDAGCALSGCGPAFVYKFIMAMARAGESCGLPADTALRLAEQTVLGAAKLAVEGGEDPEVLCRNVCSPGGATIEGVRKLEGGTFDDEVAAAVRASFERTIELSKC